MTPQHRALMVSVLLLATAGISGVARPRLLTVEPENRLQLETLVPPRFQDWAIDATVSPVMPDESVQAKLRQLYDQTLARVYVDPEGRQFMLVIAYGGRQVDGLRAHQPEDCYAAQGFEIRDLGSTSIGGQFGSIRARRLVATRGVRVEPMIYWFTIGGRVANSVLEQKVEQVRAGFEGKIPEGFLIRASLIGPADPQSYARLEHFLSSLLAALPSAGRRQMAGA